MQRPRRTSEFHEETQTNKRQSRQQQRLTTAPSPAPNTAQKYVTRQSRIAVPTRPSSVDRGAHSLGVGLIGLQPNSASRGRSTSTSRPTPQKTPLDNKLPTSRVLFTAEKHRNVALHNDKRWIQDQVQRITEFLESKGPGQISGITSDFFSARSGGLRQMSIKQFVAIVNYFLHFVSGNRFTVGSNHVEDIVNILQKLQYPHQVNKSWLKTPNTQHSLGNVILLLDFFMDFVPPNDTDVEQDKIFPFLQPPEYTSNQMEDENMNIPDEDFQAQMLRHTEEGFMLWDKQLDEEFKALQQQTCDELIFKRSGVKSFSDVEEEIEQLKQRLRNLENCRPQIKQQDEEEYNHMQKDLKYTEHNIQMLHDDVETGRKQLKQLESKITNCNVEVSRLDSEVKSMQSMIDAQICSVEQRDKLIEEVVQLKHILQNQEGSLRDLQDYNHHQQVILSRTKKQLMDQIHKFNGFIREITYSQIYSNVSVDELQLPVQANRKDLNRIVPIINDLCIKTESMMKQISSSLQQVDKTTSDLTHDVESTLYPKLNSLNTALSAAQQKFQQCEQHFVKERSVMEQNAIQLEKGLHDIITRVKEYQGDLAKKQEDVVRLAQENEETMANAEKTYYEYSKAREEYLDRYAESIEIANNNLQELTIIVKANEELIIKLKEENLKS